MQSFQVSRCAYLLIAGVCACIFCWCSSPAIAAQSAPVTINSSVTLVESPQESEAVRRATENLRSDFTRVFGTAPRLVNTLGETGPIAILIAERSHHGV